MQKLLEKGDLIYTGNGYTLFTTDDHGVCWMEWERPQDCKLAHQLNKLVRAHALFTNLLQKISPNAMLVRHLDPIQLTVRVHSTHNDSQITLLNAQGEAVSPAEAERIPGAKKSHLECMQDAALHLVRSLRAHLLANGVEEITLRLSFGVADGGACVMQVINPADCDFGIGDEDALYKALGGDLV